MRDSMIPTARLASPLPAKALPLLALAFALALTGCASIFGISHVSPEKESQVMALLDKGQPQAALTAANELVAKAPDDYEGYLTRNAVQLVLRDYEAAQADNERALEKFEAHKDNYPDKEYMPRLAKIHESLALTALVASRRAPNEAQRARWETVFEQQADMVKALDEETWKHLKAMVQGEAGK